ncbi:putative transcription factor bHLH041 [Zea mays]|uniref:Putative transcription factor bHLH041 n=1 Tax=Zea mays TaxID=4577 RepID=A0A3L6E904_MAIZE|nr:putative transcription factor bHLH041 [Zea mays]
MARGDDEIYMLMDMELEHELHLHHNVPPQGSSQQQLSSAFLPFAVSSDVTSSPVLTSSSTTAFCQQPVEASPSPLDTPFSPLPYSYSDTIPDLEEIMSRPRHMDGHAESGTSAFRQYVRHLRPKKKLKQGGCGQRAIKTAMSVLARMHSSRLSQWQMQISSTEMAAAVPSDESKNIQLLHVRSERKRREKINDSFEALKNALPPSCCKRDKTSILMRARDYINSLKSRVSELEENGKVLESQLCSSRGDNGGPLP